VRRISSGRLFGIYLESFPERNGVGSIMFSTCFFESRVLEQKHRSWVPTFVHLEILAISGAEISFSYFPLAELMG